MFPSWIRSRNDRPRLRYFLAIETTSRRLPPESSRLACSYLPEPDVHRLDALGQRLGRLEGDPHQVLEFLDQVGAVFLAGPAGAVFLEQEDQLVHPGRDLLEPLHQRLDLLGPDRQLLDQVDRLAAPAA